METKTVFKWYWVWDFAREEAWLNAMAREGWLLDRLSFCTYHFIACEPGEYTVRLEAHSPDSAYIDFMAETGAEYVGRMAQWIYFRRKTELGAFDLFSDIDSKIAHLNRLGKVLFTIGLLNLGIGLMNTFNPRINMGWVNLLCCALLMYALGRIHGMREGLKAERMLHE